MKNLMTVIYQQIDQAHPYKTYNGIAPSDAEYPYVVYKVLPVQNTEQDRDDFNLEISCWDKSTSTSHGRVVDIADAIKLNLKRFRHLDEHNLMIFSSPSVGYIPDPDEQVKRYDVTSTLLTYRRS